MKRILLVFIAGISCMWCEAQSNALSERKWSPSMEKVMEWVDMELENGWYKGRLYDGRLSGLGVYRWSDGSWYWGRWSSGEMNGKAIYLVPEGCWVGNCPDCVYYVGDHSSNRKSGTGTCYDEYGRLIYHGNFSDDRPTDNYPSRGFAGYRFECFEYSGGDIYIGETYKGQRHGYGIYLWSDGKAWYGAWKNGAREGYGIFMPYKGSYQWGRWTGDTYTATRTTSDVAFTKVRTRNTTTVPESSEKGFSLEYVSGESDQEVLNRAVSYYNAGDYAKAVPLFRRLAEQGMVEGQYNLGLCYYNGHGVGKSYSEAAGWYRKSAEQGFVSGQYNLGVFYYNGYGVGKSYSEAVKWYRKAADQGDAFAQFNLGACYAKGEGVEKNATEAVKWYRKATYQGHSNAMRLLGRAYESGEGVEKNGNKALYWYKKGLDKGIKDGSIDGFDIRFIIEDIDRLEKAGYSADRAGIK